MNDKTQLQTRGLVLRSNNFSEADRFCTILSPSLGLIEAKARGARRSRSTLLLGTEFLTLADFELFYYKDRYTINSADVVYAFPRLRSDIERLTCASHLSELLRDLLMPDEVSQELYELLARSLSALEKDEPAALAVVHATELRLMRLGGFGLDLRHCVLCQKELAPDQAARFDFEKMGLSCAAHQTRITQPSSQTLDRRERSFMDLSAAALAAIDWFSHSKLDQLFSFKCAADVDRELAAFSRQYLAWNMDKHYTKLDMLTQFNQLGL